MDLIDRLKAKHTYWQGILSRQRACDVLCRDHQVKLRNWSHPFELDLWLVDFIEKRGLLAGKPQARIALYSIFAPFWLSYFDRADARIFVERENLHKPSMQSWLHRCLDDERVALSLGFDDVQHPQYLRFPFWLMWSVFSPTATHEEIKRQIAAMDAPENHSYGDRNFCAYVCSHDDYGRRQLFDQLCAINKVHADGRLFHNNDDLKKRFNDDKLSYLRQYRFNLTPENTNFPGYVTEKPFEAIHAGCIPIYHGSDNQPEPEILNPEAFIFVEMGADNTQACQLIEELNADERRYMDFACQPRFKQGADEWIWTKYEKLESRFKAIISNI